MSNFQGGDSRRIWINSRARSKREARCRGITFTAPRRSLDERGPIRILRHHAHRELHAYRTTPLHTLSAFYPDLAKMAGAARVRTFAEWRVFRGRYFQRNPIGYIEWHLRQRREALTLPRSCAQRGETRVKRSRGIISHARCTNSPLLAASEVVIRQSGIVLTCGTLASLRELQICSKQSSARLSSDHVAAHE